jgi:hypothetical protein
MLLGQRRGGSEFRKMNEGVEVSSGQELTLCTLRRSEYHTGPKRPGNHILMLNDALRVQASRRH